MSLDAGSGVQMLPGDGVELDAGIADGWTVDEGAGLVWVDATGARDGGGDGVSGRPDGGCRDGAYGGVNTAGRDEQAVSMKRTAIASQLCETLAFIVIWVYNLF
jgi:hypothetical protein